MDDRIPQDPPSGTIASRPVFIVGAPRSGTSWVQRLLLADPMLCGGQETHFFNVFGSVIHSYHKHQTLGRNVGLPSYWEEPALLDEIRTLWDKTVAPLIERFPNARLLVEKTPDHATVLPEILQLLPSAKVIHVVRDSRSVVASLLAARESWGAQWAPRTARDAAILWYRYTHQALVAGSTMSPGQFLSLRYEDLMRDGVRQTQRLFAFLGIEKSDHCVKELVDQQSFSRQKDAESPIPVVRGDAAEPKGFFRHGKIDGWCTELSFRQKLVVWQCTRKLMYELGYDWIGAKAHSIHAADRPAFISHQSPPSSQQPIA